MLFKLFFTACTFVLPFARAATWEVSVGKGALVFDPPFVQDVQVGDVINFTFNPKKHSVTQSAFDTPCSPLGDGFNSGLIPVDVNATTLPTWQLTVNDTASPIWAYCQNPGPPTHCSQGMVFAINPPTEGDRTFQAFQLLANATAASNNSSATSTSSTATIVTSAKPVYSTPPPPSAVTVTVTVTAASSTWTTTYASYLGSPPPTPAPESVDHKVTVGANNELTFSPSAIQAAVGDTVTFTFVTKNHTVTRSSFSAPCQPLVDTATDPAVLAGFFDSGFKPVANGNSPIFQIKVNDTAPIWAYCKQTNGGSHCGQGMVFSVNAVESGPNNFAAFQALAKRINGTSDASGTVLVGGSATGATSSPSSASSGSDNNAAAVMKPHGMISLLGVLLGVALL